MEMSVAAVSKIVRAYDTQMKTAEYLKQSAVRTVQNQADRVTISPEARQKLAEQTGGGASGG